METIFWVKSIAKLNQSGYITSNEKTFGKGEVIYGRSTQNRHPDERRRRPRYESRDPRHRPHGRRHHIVVVAEGVGHVHEYAQTIEEETGLETRVTVLGYIQRGGAPSGRDRVSAAMMGVRAIDVLKSDASSRVIVERNGRFEDMDIEEALQMKRELDEEMFVACNRIDTSYQYHHKKTT